MEVQVFDRESVLIAFVDGACCSLVESEHPVAEGDPEGTDTSNRPEAAMVLGTPLPDVLVSTIAEWGIG